MPLLISREEALERIRAERGTATCLMCGLVARAVGEVHVVYEDLAHVVLLPRYVRRWGQITVIPKVHVTTFQAIPEELWARTNELAFRAARAVEAVHAPFRTFIASTGSCAGELLNSSEHLHVHVVPLAARDDRPADVFSWRAGVLVGEPEEWAALLASYRAVFRA